MIKGKGRRKKEKRRKGEERKRKIRGLKVILILN